MTQKPYTEVTRCRICGNRELISLLSLGDQCLTGVFPKARDAAVTSGPLELVRCAPSRDDETCGLVQLRQSYNKDEMYGGNYGYHSGLNQSMVAHLRAIVKNVLSLVSLEPGDLIIDIGSNDATLLKAYPRQGPVLVGIDPAGIKLKKYYPDHIQLIPDYFSAKILQERFGDRKAKIVTSIAMFYDLEAPMEFMRQVRDILADDGVWVMEQSYLPAMLAANAYDTICHEHLEYYGLGQIRWMAERIGLRIIDAGLNDVNGGSFFVILANARSPLRSRSIDGLLAQEQALDTLRPFKEFKIRIARRRDELRRFFQQARSDRRRVAGYGASTKGNVILQFCGLTAQDVPCIGEVNEDKFACFTPGTCIPIVPEKEAKAARPDYLLVLPWHFREFIIRRETNYLRSGGKLVFPLPRFEIYGQGEHTPAQTPRRDRIPASR